MANDLHTGQEQASLTGLLTGIVNDIQELFKQQLALLKHELRKDVRETATAGAALLAGAAVSAIGAMLFGFFLVYGVAEWAGIPLWGSYLIFAAVFLVTGGTLVLVGASKFKSSNILPEESALALKENVQWIMKPK